MRRQRSYRNGSVSFGSCIWRMSEQNYASWNPWHGCTKYSEGCRYCYVYRQDEAYGSTVSSEQCRKTQQFSLPVKTKRDGTLKIAPGSLVMTCFTSENT